MKKNSFPRVFSLCSALFLCLTVASSSDALYESFFQCLTHQSKSSGSISQILYTPQNPSYKPVLQSLIHNLRFNSSSTPKPQFIVTPTHLSHIQAAFTCSRINNLQVRIRSGGHDYDGLSYVSNEPFVIIDMFNLRSIEVNVEEGTAWVQSGATLGELYHGIAKKSSYLAFPAGVCPTVGVGGHFSGGGYGNMMRKYGLTVDHVIDASIIDVNGRILNRKSMGENLFWAIRGGGGASFGVIVSWKIKLTPVPPVVTVFKIERTLEQNATNIVHKWQSVAPQIDENLFIRLVLMPSIKPKLRTIRVKFVSLFLGNSRELIEMMNEKLPELGLQLEDCKEMKWVESVLFWNEFPNGTTIEALLERKGKQDRFLKKKSDYVQQPISKPALEGMWKKMIQMEGPILTFNPYGGKMSQISEPSTPMPHRAGNLYKIQYSITWQEDGVEVANQHLDTIRKMYSFMAPYVSKSPRAAYINYRDVDLGVNKNGDTTYEEAGVWGTKYFKGNFKRLVQVKTMVDPQNFFRYEQSIPPLASQQKNAE